MNTHLNNYMFCFDFYSTAVVQIIAYSHDRVKISERKMKQNIVS